MEKKEQQGARPATDRTETMPVVQEEVRVGKRARVTGVTRVRKTIEEREETVNEPLFREEVQIERIPINRFVEKAVPVRYEEDTTIIPVFEEVLIVEKRLLLKEEIHLKKKGMVIHEPQRVTLRSETAVVEHGKPDEKDKYRD